MRLGWESLNAMKYNHKSLSMIWLYHFMVNHPIYWQCVFRQFKLTILCSILITHVGWRPKNFKVCIIYFWFISALNQMSKHKRRNPVLPGLQEQGIRPRCCKKDFVYVSTYMPVLWSFRSVLIAGNSKQRRLASEMLQYVAWRKASGRWARLRPNDVTDSFNLLPFI